MKLMRALPLLIILFLSLACLTSSQEGHGGEGGQGGQGQGGQGQGQGQGGQQGQGHEGQQGQQGPEGQQGQQNQGQQQGPEGQQGQQNQGQQQQGQQQQGQQQGQQNQGQQQGQQNQGEMNQGQQNQGQQNQNQMQQGQQQQQNNNNNPEQQRQQEQQQQQQNNDPEQQRQQEQQQQQQQNNDPEQQRQQEQQQQQQQQQNNDPEYQRQQQEQQQQQQNDPEWQRQQEEQMRLSQTPRPTPTPSASPSAYPSTSYPTFVYTLDFGHTKETKVVPKDGSNMGYFGSSVSLHHRVAVVGSYGARDQGDNSGAAYIYSTNASFYPGGFNGTTPWTFDQKIKLDATVTKKCDDRGNNCRYEEVNNARNSQFGYAVSIWNNTVIVGAHRQEDRNAGGGAAYIYTRSSGMGSWSQTQQISPSDSGDYHYFGYSVAMYEDYAILGAVGDDHAGTNAGAAYMFRYYETYNKWFQAGKLTSSTAAQYDNFGSAVAIYKDYVCVGAYGDSTQAVMAGAAYVYSSQTGTWSQEVQLIASDPGQHDYFGYAVAIYNNVVVVGAYQANGHWDNAGAAYVFTKRTDGIWLQQAKLIARDGMTNDFFGHSVALYKDTVVLGAFGEQGKEVDGPEQNQPGQQQNQPGQQQNQPGQQQGQPGQQGQGQQGQPGGQGQGQGQAPRRILQGGQPGGQQGQQGGQQGQQGQPGQQAQGQQGQPGQDQNQGPDQQMQQQMQQMNDPRIQDQMGENCGPNSRPDCQQEQGNYKYRGTNAGSVYVFARSGSTWYQEFKLLPKASEAYDAFGCSVSLYEDVLLVGSDMTDGVVANTGAAYFYAPPSMSPTSFLGIRKQSSAFAPFTGEVELDAILATCLILVPAAMASVWWYLRFKQTNLQSDRSQLPTDSQHSSFAPWSAHGVFDESARGSSTGRSGSRAPVKSSV